MCVATSPNIEVKALEQFHNSQTETCNMTGVEVWGLEDGWKEIGKVFCTRILVIPNIAENGVCV
jgi:hypothetical protein